MSYKDCFRSPLALAALAVSLTVLSPSAHASLFGTYLVKNAGTGQCLRASNVSALYVVSVADCDANDPSQRWKVTEVAITSLGYGMNTLSLVDSAGNRLCMTGANYYTSHPHLKACVSDNDAQLWTTSGPINYGNGYGDSYRLRWNRNTELCTAASDEASLKFCVGEQNANRPYQQWNFLKQ